MKMALSVTLAVLIALLATSSDALAGWDEGVAAFTSKNYNHAVVEFERVVAQEPKNWEAHYYLGRAHAELGDLRAATRSLRTALRRSKKARPEDNKRVWKQLGYVYEKQKKYAKAEDAYLKAGEKREAARVERLKKRSRARSR